MPRMQARAQEHHTKAPGQGWRCYGCDAPLPRSGKVWRWRWRKWQQSGRPDSGLYCDYCADARESGHDY